MSTRPDAFEAAWQRVVSNWDDDRAHQAFLALGATLNRLPDVGRCYRDVRDSDPQRRERARQQLSALVLLATNQLHDSSRRPTPRMRRAIEIAGVALALFLVTFFLMQLQRFTAR